MQKNLSHEYFLIETHFIKEFPLIEKKILQNVF